MKRIANILKKQWQIILLLIYGFGIRLVYIYERILPFTFDHGKDFLAIFHMWITQSPKLIGPWTSIPGLYFGPGWYYLLAPFYGLSNFNLVAGVIPMILLVLIQIWLVNKYFGLSTAIMVTTLPVWLSISKSAWNPFPMTFITWIVLIIMHKVDQNKLLNKKLALILGISVAFGFHFSAAFAVFYLPILLVIAIIRRWRASSQSILFLIAGFMIPFIPQVIFELRHNFVQTKAVINYFSNLGSHSSTYGSFGEVVISIVSEIRTAVTPDLNNEVLSLLFIISLMVGISIVLFRRYKIDAKLQFILFYTVIFSIISIIGLWLIHYNVWYVLGLLPVWTVLVGYLIDQSHRIFKWSVLVIFLLSPLIVLYRYQSREIPMLMASRQFLPIKETAIQKIYQIADGQPFASYHYVPDIYDFSYQSLFFIEAWRGRPLPTEFSYEPGVPEYYQGKTELVDAVNHRNDFSNVDSAQPSKVFFIVEKPFTEQFLTEWWGRQRYNKIEQQIVLSPELTLFVASPVIQSS